MNYYNPYLMSYPYVSGVTNQGLFSRLFGGLNLSSILSGTQKTLNIVNQTIPLVKQAAPIVRNAKTMFKVMNEFKKVETPKKKKSVWNFKGFKNKNKSQEIEPASQIYIPQEVVEE